MFTLGCEVGYGVSDWGVRELGSGRVGAAPLECEWQSFKDFDIYREQFDALLC